MTPPPALPSRTHHRRAMPTLPSRPRLATTAAPRRPSRPSSAPRDPSFARPLSLPSTSFAPRCTLTPTTTGLGSPNAPPALGTTSHSTAPHNEASLRPGPTVCFRLHVEVTKNRTQGLAARRARPAAPIQSVNDTARANLRLAIDRMTMRFVHCYCTVLCALIPMCSDSRTLVRPTVRTHCVSLSASPTPSAWSLCDG